jgi:hypothetical protein
MLTISRGSFTGRNGRPACVRMSTPEGKRIQLLFNGCRLMCHNLSLTEISLGCEFKTGKFYILTNTEVTKRLGQTLAYMFDDGDESESPREIFKKYNFITFDPNQSITPDSRESGDESMVSNMIFLDHPTGYIVEDDIANVLITFMFE